MMPSGFAIFYCMVSAKLLSLTSVHMSQRVHLVTLAIMLIHGCFFCLNMYLTENTTALVTVASRVNHRNSCMQQVFLHCGHHVGIIGDRRMKYRGGNLQCHDDHAMLQVWIMGFWVNNACSLVGGYQCLERTWSLCLFPVDGGSRFDCDIGNHLPDYMVPWPRRPHSKFSPLWKSRIWNIPWH
jgi:hypothetical protein